MSVSLNDLPDIFVWVFWFESLVFFETFWSLLKIGSISIFVSVGGTGGEQRLEHLPAAL